MVMTMYEFVGKQGKMYLLNSKIKFNYNCPDDEKIGSGSGSCGGGKNTNITNIPNIDDISKITDISEIDEIIKLVNKQFNTEYNDNIPKVISEKTKEKLGYKYKDILNVYAKTSPEAEAIANRILNYKNLEKNLYSQRRKLSEPINKPVVKKPSIIINNKIVGTPFEKASFGVIDSLPKTQLKSLITYLIDYNTINDTLLSGDEPSSDIKNMDKIFDKSITKDDIITYRGFSEKGWKDLDKKVGKEFSYKGYMSCSNDSDIVESFAEEPNGKMLIAEIHVTPGTRAMYIGNKLEKTIQKMGNEFEMYESEDETIIDRSTNFKVVDYKEDDNKILLVLKTIPKKQKKSKK